jgi:glyoxylase I family protein
MIEPAATRPPAAVHHLAVLCTDLERSETFYVEVLGLRLLQRHLSDDGAHRSSWVALGESCFLALERADSDAVRRAETGAGWHCVALRIAPAERETWRARLVGAGHPVERETRFTLYVRDPDGALVGLSHHPEAATV